MRLCWATLTPWWGREHVADTQWKMLLCTLSNTAEARQLEYDCDLKVVRGTQGIAKVGLLPR